MVARQVQEDWLATRRPRGSTARGTGKYLRSRRIGMMSC